MAAATGEPVARAGARLLRATPFQRGMKLCRRPAEVYQRTKCKVRGSVGSWNNGEVTLAPTAVSISVTFYFKVKLGVRVITAGRIAACV